jgi:hypothetical protein
VTKRSDISRVTGLKNSIGQGSAMTAAPAARPAMAPLHPKLVSVDADYHAWLLEQSEALRNQRHDKLDWLNLAEELDSMARAERRELRSRFKTLLAHLLKWRYQAKKRSRSWEGTIDEQRLELEDLLDEEPSLSSYLPATIDKAYRLARAAAGREMSLGKAEWESLFPSECPWQFEQLMDGDFWPEAPTGETTAQPITPPNPKRKA